MIGCGGSGCESVSLAREAVKHRLERQGWKGDFPKAWQFLGVDSPWEQNPAFYLPLPNNDYVSLSHKSLEGLHSLISLFDYEFGNESNPKAFHESQGWARIVAPDFPRSPSSQRHIYRMLGLSNQGVVKERIKLAFAQCTGYGPELAEVSRHLGLQFLDTNLPDPLIFVIGSMAGGTGSGIMLDVVDLIRGTDIKGAFPTLVAFTPDVFDDLGLPFTSINSAAFTAEMLSAYWDESPCDSALIPSEVPRHGRGPHSIFFIGRSNMGGLYCDLKNVYRSASQTLAELVTSPSVQTLFHNYIQADWKSRAQANAGGYGFQSSQMRGVVSSFGSAIISIGRNRFHEYLKKLLHRSIVEQLLFGFLPTATALLGDAAKSLDHRAMIAVVAREYSDRFASDCGLSDCESKLNEIRSRFLSNKDTEEGSQLTQKIADQMLNDILRQWGSDIFQKTLIATNEYAVNLSMPVVLSLLKLSRETLVIKSSLFRENEYNDAPTGTRSATIDFVQARLALALESIATTMLPAIETSITRSSTRIRGFTETGVVWNWPKIDGPVPYMFEPERTEFFLEDYKTWPTMVRELVSKSLGAPAGLPIDPIEAAGLLIIKGGFGGRHAEVKPLIWANSNGYEPVWEPSQQVSIEINDDTEQLSDRINAWLMRPATEMLYVLTESLSSYLMPTHPKTGAAIADHQQRLATFQQKLSQALMMSKPLINIDLAMNDAVHPNQLSYFTNIQGFPFGEGHPAREGTVQVIQGFLGVANVDWVFSSGDAESMLITNFLKYPVNPSVVKSFTHIFAREIPRNWELRWEGRRARVLGNFIPLPEDLRMAAIRGFAIARILGLTTYFPNGKNQISTKGGVFDFPETLRTRMMYHDEDKLLPKLLEAMVLTFADVPDEGKAAFNAYGALVDYGTGGSLASGFEIDGLVEQILKTGKYKKISVLDQERADALGTSVAERIATAKAYLDGNIQFFDELFAKEIHRYRDDGVRPDNTLTRELLPDLRKGYSMVREAIDEFENRQTNSEID